MLIAHRVSHTQTAAIQTDLRPSRGGCLACRHGFREDWSFDVVSATQRLLGVLLNAPREGFEEALRHYAATLPRPQGPLRR